MVSLAGRGKQITATGLSELANRPYHRAMAPYTAEQMVKWLNHVCLGEDWGSVLEAKMGWQIILRPCLDFYKYGN